MMARMIAHPNKRKASLASFIWRGVPEESPLFFTSFNVTSETNETDSQEFQEFGREPLIERTPVFRWLRSRIFAADGICDPTNLSVM